MSDKIEVNSSTVDTAVEKVSGMLDQLAQQLGVAVEHFYPVFVQQQVITGTFYIVMSAVTLLVGVLFGVLMYLAIKDKEEAAFALGSVSFVFLMLAGITGWSGFTHLYNPEYGALIEIGKFARDFK